MTSAHATPPLSNPSDPLRLVPSSAELQVHSAKAIAAELGEDVEFSVFEVEVPHIVPLWKALPADCNIGDALYKISTVDEFGTPRTRRMGAQGEYRHPFDFPLALQMRVLNPHHSSCLDTLASGYTGQGMFYDGREEDDPENLNELTGLQGTRKLENVYEILDTLHPHGWDAVLRMLGLDMASLGNSWVEVIRESPKDPTSKIVSVNRLPPQCMSKVQFSDNPDNYYWAYRPKPYDGIGHDRTWTALKKEVDIAYAPFGQLASMRAAVSASKTSHKKPRRWGECIHFMDMSELWEHYGAPRWLGAHAYLELARVHMQRTHDYYHNRATPDSVTFIYGMRITKEQRGRLEMAMNAGSGRGYGRATVVVLPNSSAQTGKVQVERFGDAITGDNFTTLNEAYAMAACSAHGVNPALAGISTPRPMGSANELPQALALMQLIRVDPVQRYLETRFRCTLGTEIELPGDQPWRIRKFTEGDTIQQLSVMARQREGVQNAKPRPTNSDGSAELKR